MFGNTLDEVIELQKDRFPYRKLPWIQVVLSQQVINNFKKIFFFRNFDEKHKVNSKKKFEHHTKGFVIEWNSNRGHIPCER